MYMPRHVHTCLYVCMYYKSHCLCNINKMGDREDQLQYDTEHMCACVYVSFRMTLYALHPNSADTGDLGSDESLKTYSTVVRLVTFVQI